VTGLREAQLGAVHATASQREARTRHAERSRPVALAGAKERCSCVLCAKAVTASADADALQREARTHRVKGNCLRVEAGTNACEAGAVPTDGRTLSADGRTPPADAGMNERDGHAHPVQTRARHDDR
jgi:hypothetical protein